MRVFLGMMRRFSIVTLGAGLRALNLLGARGVDARGVTGIGVLAAISVMRHQHQLWTLACRFEADVQHGFRRGAEAMLVVYGAPISSLFQPAITSLG